jgi:hypothetical protein
VFTGEYIFETGFERSKAVGSIIGTEKVQDGPVGKVVIISEYTVESLLDSSASDSIDDSLVDPNSETKKVDSLFGCEEDILISSLDYIYCILLKCQSIWRTCVTRSNSLTFTKLDVLQTTL